MQTEYIIAQSPNQNQDPNQAFNSRPTQKHRRDTNKQSITTHHKHPCDVRLRQSSRNPTTQNTSDSEYNYIAQSKLPSSVQRKATIKQRKDHMYRQNKALYGVHITLEKTEHITPGEVRATSHAVSLSLQTIKSYLHAPLSNTATSAHSPAVN